jgi:hypothetical protein
MNYKLTMLFIAQTITTPAAFAGDDAASEAMRILDNIKARPGQVTTSADPTAGAGGSRSYNLDYMPRGAPGGA